MKLIGLNCVVCLLLCFAVARTVSASDVEDGLTEADEHPVLLEIIKFLVNYFTSRDTVVVPEGIERVAKTIFGNETWAIDVGFRYKISGTNCMCAVTINEDSVHLNALRCDPDV
ncbi:hypothetical protein RUM43_009994 [Polyplax serrata]|uniref:Uncharacterized protein n=1 Tax=Polyplax serrata TaxID=468196 RepID=A0AAN8P3F0_POLSC